MTNTRSQYSRYDPRRLLEMDYDKLNQAQKDYVDMLRRHEIEELKSKGYHPSNLNYISGSLVTPTAHKNLDDLIQEVEETDLFGEKIKK